MRDALIFGFGITTGSYASSVADFPTSLLICIAAGVVLSCVLFAVDRTST